MQQRTLPGQIKSTDLIDTCNVDTIRIYACIMPIFLYGCEVWVLTKDLLQLLESFQAELGKRILCLPPYYNHQSVLLLLNWPSMHARLALAKLSYFLRVVTSAESTLASKVYTTIAASNVCDLYLVQECNNLEEGSHIPSLVTTLPLLGGGVSWKKNLS